MARGSHGLPLHVILPHHQCSRKEGRKVELGGEKREAKEGPDVMLMLLQGSDEEPGHIVLSHESQACADTGCSTLAHHPHTEKENEGESRHKVGVRE